MPFLADSSMFISGVAASRTKVCIWAEALSASFADFGSLDCTVLSSLGHLVYRVSGNGCFLFMLWCLLLGREQEKVSSTIFIMVADSFVIPPRRCLSLLLAANKLFPYNLAGHLSRPMSCLCWRLILRLLGPLWSLLGLWCWDWSSAPQLAHRRQDWLGDFALVVLCCTLAFPSIWSTLAEMLCISERMELWLDMISSCSYLSIEVKSPSESRRWW